MSAQKVTETQNHSGIFNALVKQSTSECLIPESENLIPDTTPESENLIPVSKPSQDGSNRGHTYRLY